MKPRHLGGDTGIVLKAGREPDIAENLAYPPIRRSNVRTGSECALTR